MLTKEFLYQCKILSTRCILLVSLAELNLTLPVNIQGMYRLTVAYQELWRNDYSWNDVFRGNTNKVKQCQTVLNYEV